MKHEPAIWNWKVRPVQWAIDYEFGGQSFRLTPGTHGPRGVVVGVIRIHESNGKAITEAEAWDICNRVWCARNPVRCKDQRYVTGEEVPPPQKPLPGIPEDYRKTTPDEYGPMLWASLHLHGMAVNFDPSRFDATIQQIWVTLHPGWSPKTGCQECFDEFESFLGENPISDVHSPAHAARWGWELHEHVNAKLGKTGLCWEDAVRLYAWDVDL